MFEDKNEMCLDITEEESTEIYKKLSNLNSGILEFGCDESNHIETLKTWVDRQGKWLHLPDGKYQIKRVCGYADGRNGTMPYLVEVEFIVKEYDLRKTDRLISKMFYDLYVDEHGPISVMDTERQLHVWRWTQQKINALRKYADLDIAVAGPKSEADHRASNEV